MDITSLAALAGNTLVAAAVTDAWETTRHRFARLFGRGQPDPAAERRLDATRRQLAAIPAAGLSQVEADLAAHWAVRLADLLEEYPDAEAELGVLVEEIQRLLPAGTAAAADHSFTGGRDVSIRASSGGMATGVIHGNVGSPDSTRPGSAKG